MKLFLIDGHALIFKMYYAFLGRPMVNTKGVDTSILFGFTKYLLELIEREKPTHIAVSFDPPGGTFRNKLYEAYKANRGETPQLVIDALEPLTKIVEAMDIPVLMIPGYEADDVIGSLAKRSAREGFTVYMVTPDKDYGQLIEDKIIQVKPGKAGGENELIDIKGVCEKWSIARPEQVIDILAICGDSSDNVPGVQGVGPVGAAKLLAKYDTTEGIYDHIDELTPRQQDQFRAAGDHISLSKTLVTIKTDIPLDVTSEQLTLTPGPKPALEQLFDLYEFPSLKRRLASIFGSVPSENSAVSGGRDCLSGDVGSRKGKGPTEWEGSPERQLCEAKPIPKLVSVSNTTDPTILADPDIPKAGHNIKETIKQLKLEGITIQGKLYDIEIMHYILNPERPHDLQTLAQNYLGIELQPEEQAATGDLFGADTEPEEIDPELKAGTIIKLAEILNAELEGAGMKNLYDEIEEPLIRVLADIELAGVKVDVSSLKEYADGLRKLMLDKEAQVRELAATPELNVSSPKQIGEVIFEKLKLDPKAKKPKSGSWPTDEQTLSEIEHPIIDAILGFRGYKKLLSTYIEPFPSYISPLDGRVHTTFNQALTSTGRLSSSNPNLQNIPIRTAEGREIRKAFVPGAKDSVIMSADYSQIELRVMAHLSGDEHLTEAFRSGVDVHSATASKIFGVPVDEVTADQRRMAKTANFGIMYGISSFGLSQRLKCSRSEAKQLIDDYFASFPSIRRFIDGTLSAAREHGYVETIFGRRRYTPDVNSSNGNIRAFAERNAVNAPIQGTAADIIKLAMIAVDKRLKAENLKSRIVLQIHDELLLEVPQDEIAKAKEILETEMQGIVKLSVPLTVECNYGKTWLEAH